MQPLASIKGATRPHSLLHRHIIAGALGIVTLAGCGDIYRYVTSGEVGWALKKEIRDRQQTVITLSHLTRFPWDELIVFSAYTSRHEICQRLKLDERACIAADLPEPLNDGLGLLVFRQNGKIVHQEIQLGWHGRFDVDERSFTPQTAVFIVEPHGTGRNGEPYLILRAKPTTPNPSFTKHSP